MREQQHKPTPTPAPIPIPAEEQLSKREGEEPGPTAGKAPNVGTSPPVPSPGSCSASALGFAVPGNLPSVQKPNQITWTNQPGSKVAKCDLRGGLAEEGPVRGRNSKGCSSSTDRDKIPSKALRNPSPFPIPRGAPRPQGHTGAQSPPGRERAPISGAPHGAGRELPRPRESFVCWAGQ